MADEQPDQNENVEAANELSRREFVTLSVAAGIAMAAGSASGAELPVVETAVQVKTPDGTCDAMFIHPTTGSHPGVLIWPDAFGLRPSMRDIGKRIAAEGFSVLVPNPFYRVAKAPVIEDPASFSFANPTDMAKLRPLMASVNAAGAAEKDAAAYVAFLDSQSQVNKAKKIGTQGYCMGGPLVMKTAAALPDRIGAGASFHGGGLVTNNPGQPAPAGAENESPDVHRHRVERRFASAGRERQAEGSVHGGQSGRRDRGLSVAPRMVRAGHAQVGGGRAHLQ